MQRNSERQRRRGELPIYIMKCLKCGLEREVFTHRPTDTVISTCPKCGGVKFTKLPAAPNFKVKDGTEKFHKRGE